MVVALLVARLAHGIAVRVIALHRAAPVLGGKMPARAVVTARQRRRIHPERPRETLLYQLVDRRAVSALERKLQQDGAGMAIDVLLSRLEVGPPGIERAQ